MTIKPIIGAKKRRIPRPTIDKIRIAITPKVKNSITGTNRTKATIISTDNDNIKAINNNTKIKIKAKKRNIKNPPNISNIKIGIDIIIIGAPSNANKNSTGKDNTISGKNIRNKKPAPKRRNGLASTSKIINPPNTKAPIIKKVPNVRNISEPIKMIAMIANPPNRKPPARMNGRNMRNAASKALKMSVAIIEKALIGSDSTNIKKAAPIQNIVVTLKNTITAATKDP